MRRLATIAVGVAAAAALTAGPALADPGSHRSSAGSVTSAGSVNSAGHGRAEAPGQVKHRPKPAPKFHPFALVGTVAATHTVTVAGDAPATVTVTIRVKGGPKQYRGALVTLDTRPGSVVKRNGTAVSVSALRRGDHIVVLVRRDAAGRLYAYRIHAQSRTRTHA